MLGKSKSLLVGKKQWAQLIWKAMWQSMSRALKMFKTILKSVLKFRKKKKVHCIIIFNSEKLSRIGGVFNLIVYTIDLF